MKRKKRRSLFGFPRRLGAGVLSAAMVISSLYTGSLPVSAAETTDSWKQDVMSALDALEDAQSGADAYGQATEDLQSAYDSLVGARSVEGLTVTAVTADTITLEWSKFESDDLVGYNVYWADNNSETAQFQLLDKDSNNLYSADGITIKAEEADGTASLVTFVVKMSTNKNHWFCVAPVTSVGAGSKCEPVMSPTAVAYETQLENIGRGLTVTAVRGGGAYLNWRLLGSELDGGYTETGLTGLDFNVYRDGEKIATVTDSTNYLDEGFSGTLTDSTYRLVPVKDGVEQEDMACSAYDIFTADSANTNVAYIDIPLQKPADTTFRETYGIDTMALSGYNWASDGYGSTTVDSTITYSANDMSVADVDGDGEYEYILEWDPSYSKDVSQQGYTGKQYIDCYELDGTLLWRLDLGVNIRAGAHYTEFGVYDFDGDGKAEMMVKTAPGTKMIKYALDENGRNVMENGSPKVASEDYVNIPAEDRAAGVTDTSNYVFSAADYREYLIEIFQDWGVWSRYSEKTVKDAIEGHWSNNLVDMFTVDTRWRDSDFYTGEASGSTNAVLALGSMSTEDIRKYLPDYKEGDKLVNVTVYENDSVKYLASSGRAHALMKTVLVEDVADYYGAYDLAGVDKDVTGVGYTKEEATILADYFLNHYQYRMDKHSLTVYEGYIITGPEYITLFDCSDGTELDTQDWYYEREDDGMLWGDYAMDFMEPGNRDDRFNVAVAYLDGQTPSCIMGRGYYTRTTMVAYNVVDRKLAVAGAIDSGWTVMTNPFNDGPHGYDGCDPVNGRLSGQGDHYIAVADVDGDGRQDIVNGGAIVSYKDGALYLYSSGGDYNANDPGKGWLKFGHGDAIHITDIDPDHPGLEIVSCFEGGAWAPYNWALRDAKSNTALFGEPGASDFGRIMIADVLPDVPGLEISTNRDAKGNNTAALGMGTNMNIKWSADMTTQWVNNQENPTITGGVGGRTTYLKADGYSTNNSTKGNPSLVADLFGDSREEIVLRRTDSTSLRIYMNTEVSGHKNYTLMHNAQYRVGIASQNSSYNQPAYTDYYYASDTDWSRVLIPNVPSDQEPGPVVANPVNVTLNSTSQTILAGEAFQLTATVIPSSADQTVTWATSDEKVATVDENGLVTGVRRGLARITATSVNGKECSCTINVIGGYKPDGLDTMPIGTTLDFIFGSEAVSTDAKTAVKADTVYSDEAGYGFAAPDKVTLTDGKDYVAGNNYRSGDDTPVYEYPTFQVKVPVGVYEVTIVQGTNGTERAVNGAYVEGNKYSVRWSSQAFATSFTEPTAESWLYTQAGETKTSTVETAVADGQLTIELATSLTDAGVSGTTYIKEIIVTRKEQITDPSATPTLRFIGDSTLAKYPPEDGGTWTPIPERTGWGEEFSMGRFMDDSVTLVNKAVAGSSIKSYIYDGYLNDFLLNSHPGDTVIIEGGINDSAAGPRASTGEEFKAKLAYVIDCCEAFGLDVILSSGTSSATTYTDPMKALAEERELHYVDLIGQWTAYQSAAGTTQGNMTVDGTHLRRVGAIVAAQLVANDIADLDGLYISGHVKKTDVNYDVPSAVVTGLYAKAQTEGSLTLAWNIDDATLYAPDQLITDFNVYSVGSDGKAVRVASQTAYISAGMDGARLQTTFAAEGAGSYYVTCVGLTGEGPASATVKVAAFEPGDRYTLSKLIETYGKQLNDASPYTVASYAAVMTALAEGEKVLADTAATEADIRSALEKAQAAVAALQLNATEFIKEDFQKEPLGTAPWGIGGSHKTLMSAEMEEDGNRLLNLYVEAAGGRTVEKVFEGAESAALEMIEFEWYPGNPDQRNVTEVEFLNNAQRVISLKTSSNGHIGYVTGDYPEGNDYKIGDGFHDYTGSTAKDLGLTNEAWYNVKIVFNFSAHTADLYIAPRDDASLKGAVVKDIAIDQTSNTITKMNFRLERGRTDGDAGNDLSILWDMYMDDYGIYYGKTLNNVDAAKYEAAEAAYLEKIKELSAETLSGEEFVLAQAVMDIMSQDVGFFTADDYKYAVEVLQNAAKDVPELVLTTSVKVTAEADSLTAGLTTKAAAELSRGANEEILWSSSDESIAKVEGTGTGVVVTALKAGSVTITARGATSGVSGDLALTVTGEAFFFNSSTAADGAYSAEKGYGFKDYTYPKAAQGWIKDSKISPDGNVYVARELSETDGVSYLRGSESGADYVAVYGQNWTEMPEGGRDEDAVPYQNTSAFAVDRKNGNYTVSATFFNPGLSAVGVQVIAEDIVRYAAGDHATTELASATVEPGQSATVSFNLALTDGQMTLRFVQNTADAAYEAAATRGVYVKSVSVDDYRTEDREKTAVLIAGDSTVQSYSDKSYRTSWAQLLYNHFGTAVKDGVNDGENKGYATYETEDTYLVNYARDARSTKSFLEEGRLNELLLNVQDGDYVLMQFAHNDDNQARPNRFVSVEDFGENIKAYDAAVKERGGTLVLVTPIALGVWEDGVLDHRFDDYRRAMLQSDLPVIDLMGSTLQLLAAMGAENEKALGIYKDTVHTLETGATMYAKLMSNLLLASDDERIASLKALMDAESAGYITLIPESEDAIYIGRESYVTAISGRTDADGAITWLSSDETIVTVDENGILKAGYKTGTAIITAGYVTGDPSTADATAYSAYILVSVTDVLPPGEVEVAADGVAVSGSKEEIADAVLTTEEMQAMADGEDIEISMKKDVVAKEEIDAQTMETINAAVKAFSEKLAAELNIGTCLNIVLHVKVGDAEPRIVTTLNSGKKLTLTIDVPEEDRLTDEEKAGWERNYKVVRVHDENGIAEATVLEVDKYNEDTHELTFKTDMFSYYLLAYYDTEKESGEPTASPVPGDPTTPPATEEPTTPPATGEPTTPPATEEPTTPPATGDPTTPPAADTPAPGDDGKDGGNDTSDAGYVVSPKTYDEWIVVDTVNVDVDGMMALPMDGYKFDFGTRNGTAEGYIGISGNMYDAEVGYGWTDNAQLTGLNASGVGVTVVDTEADPVLAAVASDLLWVPNGQLLEFAIDLPAGTYRLDVLAAAGYRNNAYNNNTVSVNDKDLGVSGSGSEVGNNGNNAFANGVSNAFKSCKLTLENPGQVVIRSQNEGQRSIMNAIIVSKYVERKDDFNADVWTVLNEKASMLKMKAGFFADDSTTLDYDVILVNRMTETLEALEAVMFMDSIADTTDGDALYALCEEAVEHKILYTETSMALLEAAMAEYQAAKAALDIRTVVKDAYDVIEFWLMGVETEYDVEPYAGYFDFNTTQTGGNAFNDSLVWEAPGWTPVGITEGHPELTLYNEELGYGLTAATGGRHRNTGDPVMDDIMMVGTFQVDLPAGNYRVITYTGDLMENCRGNSIYDFYTGYVDADNKGTLIASLAQQTSAAASILQRDVEFTLDEAATVTVVIGGYSNAIVFEQYVPAQVETYPIEDLENLVAEINAKSLVETDYTVSTWTAFKEAYDKAAAAIERGKLLVQEGETVKTNLQAAYAALTARVATGQLFLDFGPAQESDTVPGQVADNILLSGYTGNVSLEGAKNLLSTGADLYAETMDDNGIHYGFTGQVSDGFTATGGAYFRDYVYSPGGKEYTFKADVPVGQYKVYVYTGCKESANTTKFFFNDGEAAAASDNTAVTVPAEGAYAGKTVYTQTSSSGGQFAEPGCIYTVNVTENKDALSTIKGVAMGTLSLTLFNDESTVDTEVTARLNGIALARIGDAGEVEVPEEENRDLYDPEEWTFGDAVAKFDFGNRSSAEGFTVVTDEAYVAGGYGFTSTGAVAYNRVGVTCVDEDADPNLVVACGDLSRADNELTFAVDMPAGSYLVEVYSRAEAANNSYNNNMIYINGTEIGKVKPGAGTDGSTTVDMRFSTVVTLTEAGQIVVSAKNEGALAILNALVITKAIPKNAANAILEGPLATETPEATEVPTATETPEATEVPTATEAPEATEEPKATETPKGTEEPKATETPSETEEPKATEAPEATQTPETTKEPEATREPEATEVPEATSVPETTGEPEAEEAPTATAVPEAPEESAGE